MSELGKIAAAMGGEVCGNRAIFPTPGHSTKDRGSWASIVPGAPDGVLIHSQNGGDALAIKDELRAKGVLPAFEPQGDSWRVTGAYEYADADGAILYRTIRKEKAGERKRFLAERPQGRGWVNGLGDLERVLYRLPDITADPAKLVYLVEGERKADKLASWGLTATAVAFGAKGWRKGYAEALAGRTVAILPDNDEPGHEFAERAKRDIEAAGGRAAIVQLPDLPPKGDIIDWTGTAEDLHALTAAVLNPPAKLLPLLDPAAWQRMETPGREWALDGWIPHKQASYLTGPGSAGKSLLSQQLCTAIALGLPFMGLETRQAVAIYITCEDDTDELHRRQKAICEALGVSLSSLSGKLHLVSLAGAIGNELATFTPEGRMSVAETYRTVQATVEATAAGFVALDNVAHLFAGNENIRNQVAAFCGLLNQLAQDIDGSVLFLGHPNKAGDSFSGSTAWENQVRSRLFLQTPAGEDGPIDPDVRELSKGKANYSRNGEKIAFRWHKWAFVLEDELPKDQREEIAATIQASADNATFLRCLAEMTRREQAVSENVASRTYAPLVFSKMPEAKGIGKARLEAAMDRLYRIDAIERGFLWRADRKDKFGLREKCADPRADPALTRCADPALTTRRHALSHTPYINISGAAHGPAAPYHEEERDPGLSPPVFAAEDDDGGIDADGNIIGWEDD